MPAPAFLPGVAPGAFTSSASCKTAATSPISAPRMAYNPVGPPHDKYLSRIPIDRLNKAPMITVTNVPGIGDAHNSIRVALVDMARDEAAGETLRAGVYVDPALEGAAPAPSKYEEYYPRDTLHEAPIISVQNGGTDNSRSVSVIQASVKTSMIWAELMLGDGIAPDPAACMWMEGPMMNKAPFAQVIEAGDKSVAYSEDATVPLDYIGANIILNKYRK